MLTPQTIARTKGVTTRDHFFFLSQKLRGIVRQDGLDLKPFVSLLLPCFATLKAPEQETILWHVQKMIELTKDLQSRGQPIGDTKILTEAFLANAGVEAPPGLIDSLRTEDRVDIYNDKNELVFASLSFLLGPDAYSLEELYCRPWREIFGRTPPYLNKRYFEIEHEVLMGQHSGPVSTGEISNEKGLAHAAQDKIPTVIIPRVISPVFEAGGKVAGFLCVNRFERPHSAS